MAIGMTIIPYPLRAHGVSVRYLPIIRHLAKTVDIDLILVHDKTAESGNIEPLKKYSRRIISIQDPRTNNIEFQKRVTTYADWLLPWAPPTTFVAHQGDRVARSMMEALNREHYTSLVWVGGYLLPHVAPAFPYISVDKVIVDFVDSPTLMSLRMKNKPFRFDFLNKYELWKVPRWERKIVKKADATVYISRVDAETAGGPGSGKIPFVIPNGVNMDTYTDERDLQIPSPNIGFLGNMAYPPNIEAVKWLFQEVFIPLKRRNPDLSLVLIGRDPVEEISNMSQTPGVIVTGTVDDIWKLVNSVDVFVFPIWTGAGVKNKILEAMFAARPVVTTDIGNEGIEGVHGQHLFISKTPENFRDEISRLISSPEICNRMGMEARSFVKEHFSWDGILRTYEELVLGHDPERNLV